MLRADQIEPAPISLRHRPAIVARTASLTILATFLHSPYQAHDANLTAKKTTTTSSTATKTASAEPQRSTYQSLPPLTSSRCTTVLPLIPVHRLEAQVLARLICYMPRFCRALPLYCQSMQVTTTIADCILIQAQSATMLSLSIMPVPSARLLIYTSWSAPRTRADISSLQSKPQFYAHYFIRPQEKHDRSRAGSCEHDRLSLRRRRQDFHPPIEV